VSFFLEMLNTTNKLTTRGITKRLQVKLK